MPTETKAGPVIPRPRSSTVDVPRQRGPRGGPIARVRTVLTASGGGTPARLTLILAILAVLTLGSGVAAVSDVVGRDEQITDVADGNGRLGLAALEVYQSLSDADATAAGAFLAGGVERPEVRARYLEDVNRATVQLATAAASITTQDAADAVAVLSAGLPVYTGYVETARTLNQQGLPVGAAYLRLASGMMQNELLPAARDLQKNATTQLGETQDSASLWPFITIVLAVATLLLLAYTQRDLAKRTNRVFNIGLLTATGAVLVLLLWTGAASILAASHISSGRENGSAQIERLAEARIAALQARTQEAVTLIARGGDAATKAEESYVTQMNALSGDQGLLAKAVAANADPALKDVLSGAQTTLNAWIDTHKKLHQADVLGDYNTAVAMALGEKDGEAGKLSRDLDQALAKAIDAAGKHFHEQTTSARNSLTGAGIGAGLLSLIALAAATRGLQRRIAEYR
ncbi:hypothetical protein Afil01_38410 [Actinorhabdospora filicis]|uniref:Secreted protein n=1 Tax=Actinorhabdospora filicis TaxID=1785913 RepID=A0A9W6SL90_9ACTN|nr:hypothetical protein [Actinorhabdospora filicis]GLZ79034.1 hypothetical protein Afil01_38410 [Actinorhabdospora filicis]